MVEPCCEPTRAPTRPIRDEPTSLRARLALAAGVLLVLGLTPAPADVGDVTPPEIGVGDSFVVEAPGFGTRRNRVRIKLKSSTDPAPRPRPRVRVTETVDGSVTGVVRRGAAGTFDVVVSKRRMEDFVVPAGLTIGLPEVSLLDPSTVLPRGEVVATGRLFGARRGKVRVAGRRARVLDWTPTSVRFALPRRVVSGTVDVEFRARAGSVTLPGALTIFDGTLPLGDDFSVTVGGRLSNMTDGDDEVEAEYTASVPLLVIRATKIVGATTTSIAVVLSIDLDTASYPVTITTQPLTTAVQYTEEVAGIPPTLRVFDSFASFGEWSVTLDSVAGDRVRGSVDGELRVKRADGSQTAISASFDTAFERK